MATSGSLEMGHQEVEQSHWPAHAESGANSRSEQ